MRLGPAPIRFNESYHYSIVLNLKKKKIRILSIISHPRFTGNFIILNLCELPKNVQVAS